MASSGQDVAGGSSRNSVKMDAEEGTTFLDDAKTRKHKCLEEGGRGSEKKIKLQQPATPTCALSPQQVIENQKPVLPCAVFVTCITFYIHI